MVRRVTRSLRLIYRFQSGQETSMGAAKAKGCAAAPLLCIDDVLATMGRHAVSLRSAA